MQRIFIKKCFLFTLGSVCPVKRFTTGSRNPLKDFRKSQMMTDQVRKWLRQQSKHFCVRVSTSVSVLVEYMSRNVLSMFERHTFYVLYPFVTYLLILPRKKQNFIKCYKFNMRKKLLYMFRQQLLLIYNIFINLLMTTYDQHIMSSDGSQQWPKHVKVNFCILRIWRRVVLVRTDVSEERTASSCPEDGGDTFLQIVGSKQDYTASDPRRRLSS
jgi:hypothetical protein